MVAFVRLGRGVVGNTTFAFWATAVVSITAVIALRNDPPYALGGMLLPWVPYFIYFFGTWSNVGKNPDPAMTGDADYVGVLVQRNMMGAREPAIVRDELPAVGAGKAAEADLLQENGDSRAV